MDVRTVHRDGLLRRVDAELASIEPVVAGSVGEYQAQELRRCLAEARRSARRYERATRRYSGLMRHRLANPLAVISGMAHTLRVVDGIDDTKREQMLDAILEQAERLRELSVEPIALDPVETALDPWGETDKEDDEWA